MPSAEQRQYLSRFEPGEAIGQALSTLLERDEHLLMVDANERSLTFRFALYLQALLPLWTVDCEYNRDGIDPKRLAHLELYPESDDENAKTVFPDVIVHSRGTKRNFVVIEFKKSSSRVDRNIDMRKLAGYKAQLGYEHGLFVELGTDRKCCIADIQWIE